MYLKNNFISDNGGNMILEGIMQNNNLVFIDLVNNKFTENFVSYFKSQVKIII